MSPAGTRQQITENVPTNRTKTMPEHQQTRETRTPANLSTKYDPKLGEANAKRFQAGVIALLKTSDHKGELALASSQSRSFPFILPVGPRQNRIRRKSQQRYQWHARALCCNTTTSAAIVAFFTPGRNGIHIYASASLSYR